MGGAIPSCCCKSTIQSALMKQNTIKVPETHDTSEKFQKRTSFIEDGNPPHPPQHRFQSSNFLKTKINDIKANNIAHNRRKSFSIAINPETLNVKSRGRSKSTFGIEIEENLTNLQIKKAYKILPHQNSNRGEDKNQFKKSLSLISVDTTTSGNNQDAKMKRQPIETINEPFTEKQLRVLKKILSKEGLIIDEMDESTM